MSDPDGKITIANASSPYAFTIHPLAEKFPEMPQKDFDELKESIRKHGLFEPIIVNANGQILDGRHRYKALIELGFGLKVYQSTLSFGDIQTKDKPLSEEPFIYDANMKRRHLTESQRSTVAAEFANMCQGERTDLEPSDNCPKVSQERAGELFNVSSKSVGRAKKVKAKDPEAFAKVKAGDLSLNAAAKSVEGREKVSSWSATDNAKESNSKARITLSGIVDKKLVEVSYPEPKGKHQFNRTNDAVDWASWTWNPVTGCLHGCKYCYAREIAYRFAETYPIQFAPLFLHERLDAPINTKPGTARAQDGRVFVCSMADLFGEWVPQKWIDSVLDATLAAPEWEYLFLTKFPQRYRRINLPPKAWFGASVDIQKRVKITEKAMPELDVAVRWISVEPMLEPLVFNDLSWCDLLVIGAQSETNQPDGFAPAFAPPLEWVIDLIAQARAAGVPVYLKPNLLGEFTGSKPGMALPQEQPRRRPGIPPRS